MITLNNDFLNALTWHGLILFADSILHAVDLEVHIRWANVSLIVLE